VLDAQFYDLLMVTFDALYAAGSAAQPVAPAEAQPTLLQLRAGLAESPGWFLIQAAEFDPEPLTVANLRVRDVYASDRIVEALLELMASEGWLARSAQTTTYALTPAGRALVERRIQRQRALVEHLTPLPEGDLALLASMLGRLIDASMAAPTPPGVWCLAHSRRRAPAMDAPALVRIAQYFSDFNAFRDDAHMAAWQPHIVDGYIWEAFAYVYAGQAHMATTLFEQLSYRGYSTAEYAAALELLTRRGWLEPAPAAGAYCVTADGNAVRKEVERLTDNYFYAPWECLAEAEIAELGDILMRLTTQLRVSTGAPGK
jgi:hypothetical protein